MQKTDKISHIVKENMCDTKQYQAAYFNLNMKEHKFKPGKKVLMILLERHNKIKVALVLWGHH